MVCQKARFEDASSWNLSFPGPVSSLYMTTVGTKSGSAVVVDGALIVLDEVEKYGDGLKVDAKDVKWSKQKDRVGRRQRCVWNVLESSFTWCSTA